jgi:hypothetical protein
VPYFIRLSDDDEYIQEAAFHHQVHKDIKTKKERKETNTAGTRNPNEQQGEKKEKQEHNSQ